MAILTVPVFLLAVIIPCVMVLHAICKLVFRMSDVINVMMSVLVVECNFVSRAFNWSVKMSETVCVTRGSTIHLQERHQCQNRSELEIAV